MARPTRATAFSTMTVSSAMLHEGAATSCERETEESRVGSVAANAPHLRQRGSAEGWRRGRGGSSTAMRPGEGARFAAAHDSVVPRANAPDS